MTAAKRTYRKLMTTNREHGKRSTYQHGCKCTLCRAAEARYVSDRRAKRTALLAADPSLAPHGSVSTYRNWGCRCTECKTVHSAAVKQWRQGEAKT